MKRPAFQFYPGDWLRDAALRSCSVGARGLWIDMLCLMHDGVPYGHLRVGSKVILPDNLARIVGATLREVEGWLQELRDAQVYSKDNHGAIYSRRMVRDEEIRASRAAGGSKGGNPVLTQSRKDNYKVNLPPNLPPTFGITPASSSASSSSSAKREGDARARSVVLNGSEPHIPSLEEVIAYGNGAPGIPRSYCVHYHTKCNEQNRWLVGPPGREAVRGWQSEIVRWWAKDRATWDDGAETRAPKKREKTAAEWMAEGKVPPECLD